MQIILRMCVRISYYSNQRWVHGVYKVVIRSSFGVIQQYEVSLGIGRFRLLHGDHHL